jgi:Ca2+-binding RTX toxin-like protein
MSHDTSEDIYGTYYNDFIRGYGGHDRIWADAGNDEVYGDDGDDDLYGESGNDYLNGGTGWDLLDGGSGRDRLVGSYGSDLVIGGSGKDTLTGDLGSYANGTLGRDIFLFENVSDSYAGATNRDVITDFRQGYDLIDLEDIDALQGSAQDDFDFVGTGFAGAGDLRYYHENGKTIIQGNTDADSFIEFEIELNGIYNLRASDFDL